MIVFHPIIPSSHHSPHHSPHHSLHHPIIPSPHLPGPEYHSITLKDAARLDRPGFVALARDLDLDLDFSILIIRLNFSPEPFPPPFLLSVFYFLFSAFRFCFCFLTGRWKINTETVLRPLSRSNIPFASTLNVAAIERYHLPVLMSAFERNRPCASVMLPACSALMLDSHLPAQAVRDFSHHFKIIRTAGVISTLCCYQQCHARPWRLFTARLNENSDRGRWEYEWFTHHASSRS